MARGRSDAFLVIRPVDVDKTPMGIRVTGVDAVEPEDAGHNQILFLQNSLCRFHRPAAFEDSSDRHTRANFFRNAEPARGRFEAALF